MQSSRLFSSFLLLLLTVVSYNLTVRAADDEAEEPVVRRRSAARDATTVRSRCSSGRRFSGPPRPAGGGPQRSIRHGSLHKSSTGQGQMVCPGPLPSKVWKCPIMNCLPGEALPA